MVLISLQIDSAKEAERLITLLLDKNLILDATIKKGTRVVKGADQVVEKKPVYLITARAKALLYEKIQREINRIYGQAMPALFATPIVYMEPGQASELRAKTQSI